MKKEHSWNSKENKYKKVIWNTPSNFGSPWMDEDLESLPKTPPRSLFKWLIDASDLPLISSSNDCLPLSEDCVDHQKIPQEGWSNNPRGQRTKNALFWCINIPFNISLPELYGYPCGCMDACEAPSFFPHEISFRCYNSCYSNPSTVPMLLNTIFGADFSPNAFLSSPRLLQVT